MTDRCPTCGAFRANKRKLLREQIAIAMSLDMACEVLRWQADKFPSFFYREIRRPTQWWVGN